MKELPASSDWRKKMRGSLQEFISKKARSKHLKLREAKVLVIIDDTSRPTPTGEILPEATDVMTGLGFQEKNITVLVALGSHRAMTEAELKKKVGSVYGRVKVVQHDAWDERAMFDFGEIDIGGVPVKLLANRLLHDCDISLAIGMVAPHVDAGYSGGGKIILPGVTHESTVTRFHMSASLMLGKHDLGYFVGNMEGPLRKASDLAGKIVGLDAIVNVVLNTREEVAGVFVGDPIRDHRRAVAFAGRYFTPKLSGPADIVIVSSYPEDIDYWQGMKAEEIAFPVVKEGGTIIVLAECPDGPCPVEEHRKNLSLLGSNTFPEIMEMVKDGKLPHSISTAIVLEMASIREKARTFVVAGGMSQDECESMGIHKLGSLQEAVEAAYLVHGKRARIAVLESSLLVPTLRKS